MAALGQAILRPTLVGDPVERDVPWSEYDIVGKPELLLDPRIKEKAFRDLRGLGFAVNEMHGTQKMPEWERSVRTILQRTSDSALEVLLAQKYGLSLVLKEAQAQHFERSTALMAILQIAEFQRTHNKEEFIAVMDNMEFLEGITACINQSNPSSNAPIPGINRVDTHANWPYDWIALQNKGTGHTAPNPLKINVDPMLELFSLLVDYHAEKYLYRPPRKRPALDPDTGNTRPMKTEYFVPDKEVEPLIEAKLANVGLDRTMVSFTEVPGQPKRAEAVTSGDQSVTMAPDQPLTPEAFKKNTSFYLQIIFHEAWHAMCRRAEMLPPTDFLRFRNLLLGMANRFDPLRSMEAIFNPNGEYKNDDSKQQVSAWAADTVKTPSLMTVTDYYMRHILKTKTPDGTTTELQLFFDEWRRMYGFITRHDIYKHLWMNNPNTPLQDFLSKIHASRSAMDPVSQMITDTMYDNMDHITRKKRSIFPRNDTHSFYTGQVLPLTLLHLALYQPEAFIDHLPQGDTLPVLKNFFWNWQKRIDRFVSNIPTEELAAEVAGHALVGHTSDYITDWKPTRNDFNRALQILIANNLARIPQSRLTA
jgi:hypothetical protein